MFVGESFRHLCMKCFVLLSSRCGISQFISPQNLASLITHCLGFHTLVRNVSFSSLIDVGSHNPTSLGGLAFSMAHRSGFQTLVKNVSFSSPIHVKSHKPPPLGASVGTLLEFSHPCKKCFILLSYPRGISQTTFLRGQHPRWHTT